jgi:hypothetical protein
MNNSFPEEELQKKCASIVKDVLNKNYINLFISNFILKEDDKEKISHISCVISFSNEREDVIMEGKGRGVVDALMNATIAQFGEVFFSLQRVEFDDFAMRVKFKNSLRRRTDAPVEIKLALKNKRGQRIYFFAESRSMVVAAISVIRKAFEYLINAERAILQLRESIFEAKGRNRRDLVTKYTDQMARLVKIISYEEVIKKNK